MMHRSLFLNRLINVIEIAQLEVQSVLKVLFISFKKNHEGASMRSYRLGYFLCLLPRSMNYFLACLLAWVSISVALAKGIVCEETGATHI